MKYLLEQGLMDGSCMTVTGKTLAENLEACARLKGGADDRSSPSTIRSNRPATFESCAAQLAPEGAVAKITGKGRPAVHRPGAML